MGERPVAGATLEEAAADERAAEREATFPELTAEERQAAFAQTESGRIIRDAVNAEEIR